MKKLVLLICAICFSLSMPVQADSPKRTYELWDDQPAPNRGADYRVVKSRGYPYDADWEEHSYPIGNGYMGASIFGRTDIERIQITEKTLANEGLYGKGGLTSFAELYLEFDHFSPQNYKRSLNLNEGLLHVDYEQDGVQYRREYLANYPENIIAVKLSSNKRGKVSFTLSAEIPYLRSVDEVNTRTGKTLAQEDLITLSGNIAHFNVKNIADAQIRDRAGSALPYTRKSNDRIEFETTQSGEYVFVF